MKACKVCGRMLPLAEFYHDNGSSHDGLMSKCKDCMKAYTRQRHEATEEPRSTREAREILAAAGIPCTTGKAIGKQHIDLAAWGCIPIEAKGATESGKQAGAFCFGFTPKQRRREYTDEIFLFMAWHRDGKRRVFVMPAEVVPLDKAPYIVMDHPCSYRWYVWSGFENAFHVIEQARIAHSRALEARL